MAVRDLGGAVVVVTGAGSGIGAATARRFAAAGSQVVCVDVDPGAAEATAAMCQEKRGGGLPRTCDVADYDALSDLAAKTEADVGPVAVLVNNAGVCQLGDFLDHDIDDWRWIRSINLDGVVHGCFAFGPAMVGRGRGQIVNVASAAAFAPSRFLNLYATTKAAVLMFSESLRGDWAGKGVGVTAICPGVISTPIIDRARLHGDAERHRGHLQTIMSRARPLRSPERVAGAAVGAVKRDPGVVVVGVEGHLGWHGRYLLPRSVREAFTRSGLIDW